MDRNVVIATVLIAVIMFVWLWVLAPPPPVEPTARESTVVDTLEVASPEAPLAEAIEEPKVPALVVDSTVTGAQTGEARLITVDNDLYRAQFSTKGATLVSFIFKTYKASDLVTPVQLVDTSSEGSIALAFTTPTNHLVDSRSFYFSTPFEGDTLRVGEEPVTLAFEAPVGAGRIRQVYTFTPGEYEVGLEVVQDNARSFSTNEGYELLWDGAVPFTEGDHQDEATRSGVFARSGGEVESVVLSSDEYDEQRLTGTVSWVAVKNKYFTAVMMPQGATRGAELEGERVGTDEGPVPLGVDFTARLLMPSPGPEGDFFKLYLGPMEFFRITDYELGLYDMVDYGWDSFEWLTRPLAKFIFIPVFTFLSSFIPNYGLVIILFAVLIKLAVYPLTKSSYVSMARMRELQPKMEAIKEKHGDNPQKQQEAMMKLYKDTGVNPIGGCLPMLLQYPIIIALWQYLPQSMELRQQGFLWANDLSAPDAILQLPFTIPLYGNFVAGFTLLMGLSMIVQMRLQMAPSANPQAKIFTYLMPVMIFGFFNRLAAGLSLYYLVYNVVTAIQQKYINIKLEAKGIGADANGKGDASDARKARRGRAGGSGAGGKKKVRNR